MNFGVTRIGVHAGPALVGNFGGNRFFDYTAHGDTMNTAARLETANKYLGTRICVSAAVADGANNFRGRPVGDLLLRGRSEPLRAFEPLSAAVLGRRLQRNTLKLSLNWRPTTTRRCRRSPPWSGSTRTMRSLAFICGGCSTAARAFAWYWNESSLLRLGSGDVCGDVNLIKLFAAATAWPAGTLLGTLALAREQSKITILHSGFPNRTPIHLLIEALAKLGYENNCTAKIELLGGEGDPRRLNGLVAGIGGQRPDVIIAITSSAAVALKNAKLSIPVVFPSCPIRSGLGIVESIAHPGGNFTGVTYSEAGVGGKRLELLLDAVASTDPGRRSRIRGHSAALESIRGRRASSRGVEILSRELKILVEELELAFEDVKGADVNCRLHGRQCDVWNGKKVAGLGA